MKPSYAGHKVQKPMLTQDGRNSFILMSNTYGIEAGIGLGLLGNDANCSERIPER